MLRGRAGGGRGGKVMRGVELEEADFAGLGGVGGVVLFGSGCHAIERRRGSVTQYSGTGTEYKKILEKNDANCLFLSLSLALH
jgi:hypothetical protein